MRLDFRIPAEAVKAEAARRIEAAYPLWRQLNTLQAGGDPVMTTFITAVRDASNTIEALEPIPPDFAADRRWPATPETT